MTERTARAIAKTVHEGHQTSAGGPLFDHVQRVAAERARLTACLREVRERSGVSIGQRRAQGLSPGELGAPALLTRAEHDDYHACAQRIAHAPGPHDALGRVHNARELYAWARRTVLLEHARDIIFGCKCRSHRPNMAHTR